MKSLALTGKLLTFYVLFFIQFLGDALTANRGYVESAGHLICLNQTDLPEAGFSSKATQLAATLRTSLRRCLLLVDLLLSGANGWMNLGRAAVRPL